MLGPASGLAGSLALAALLGCSGSGSGGGFSTSVPGGSALEALSPAQATQLCDDLDGYFAKLVTSPSGCQTVRALATGEYAAANPTATDDMLQQFCAGAATACTTPPTDAGQAYANAVAVADVARMDGGHTDGGHPDAARADAGHTDAGRADAGRDDAGHTDAGRSDAGSSGGALCGSTTDCTATVSQVSACANDSGSALAKLGAMFPSCSAITRAKLATLSLDAGVAKPTSCIVLDNECPGWRPPLSPGLEAY